MKPTYKLATRKISELTWDQGYRSDAGDIAELTASILAKGLLQPITINQTGRVLAGRRRIQACVAAKLTEIPVIIKATDGELDEREIELFENLHRKNLEWQEQMNLTARIHELMVEKHGGNWSQRATAKLLGKDSHAIVNNALSMTEAIKFIPELANERTADMARRKYKRLLEEAVVAEALEEARSSDQASTSPLLWADTDYMIGDSLTELAKLDFGMANFAEVDPPYAIDLKNSRPENMKSANSESYNEISATDYPKFIKLTANHIYRILDDNSWCVWWYGPTWHQFIFAALKNAGFSVDDIPCVWTKPNTASPTANPNTYLNRGYEPFFLARKGSPLIRKRGRSNVFDYPALRSNRIHATQRPVELIQDVLETLAYPGARVLVPFLGSGNTLIAARRAGMTAFGWDISDAYKGGFMKNVSETFANEPELPLVEAGE